jgi:hypothetical protein
MSIIYGMKWKCEGPFQATDIETAYFSTTGKVAVSVAYSNAFQRKTHDWAWK